MMKLEMLKKSSTSVKESNVILDEFYQGSRNGRYAELLHNENISWWFRPMQGEQVTALRLYIGMNMSESTVRTTGSLMHTFVLWVDSRCKGFNISNLSARGRRGKLTESYDSPSWSSTQNTGN
jgi:hypothetical protein